MDNKERVCIFIDGSNFYHCLRKDIGDVSVDFQKLAMDLCGKDRHLIRTYYYNAPLDMSHDKEKYKKQQQFFDMLRKMPNFKVILVRIRYGYIGKWRWRLHAGSRSCPELWQACRKRLL